MASPVIIPADVIVQGNLSVTGSLPPYARTNLGIDTSQEFEIPLVNARVFDAFASVLPAAGTSDDLGLYGQTHGTGGPYIGTGDVKAGGTTTRKARVMIQVPHNYVAGASIFIRAYAGMITTISDGAATLNIAAYRLCNNSLVQADGNLYAGAAQSIKFTTFANLDFALTPTNIVPGSLLDLLLTVAITDAATGTAVIGAISKLSLCCSVQG